MAAYKPTLGSPFSGSIAGVTFAHNKGGAYARNRVIPVNPNSLYQQQVKAIFAALSTAWSNTLTQAQRDAWQLYADNVPRPSKIGGTQFLTGIAMFIRSNTPLLQSGGTAVLDGPTAFDVGTYTAPTFSITTPATQVSVFFDNTDAWANEDDSYLLLWGGKPQSQGVGFYKGPFRVMVPIAGDALIPPTSPTLVNFPFPIAVTNKAWFRANVVRADGRLSDPVTLPSIVA